MIKRLRGYVNPFDRNGTHVPSKVQNIVIRDYCHKQEITYLLSMVEYWMPGCRMVLGNLLKELEIIDGIVFYSLLALPSDEIDKQNLYEAIQKQNRELHFALEGVVAKTPDDFDRLEDLLLVNDYIARHAEHQEIKHHAHD